MTASLKFRQFSNGWQTMDFKLGIQFSRNVLQKKSNYKNQASARRINKMQRCKMYNILRNPLYQMQKWWATWRRSYYAFYQIVLLFLSYHLPILNFPAVFKLKNHAYFVTVVMITCWAKSWNQNDENNQCHDNTGQPRSQWPWFVSWIMQ